MRCINSTPNIVMGTFLKHSKPGIALTLDSILRWSCSIKLWKRAIQSAEATSAPRQLRLSTSCCQIVTKRKLWLRRNDGCGAAILNLRRIANFIDRRHLWRGSLSSAFVLQPSIGVRAHHLDFTMSRATAMEKQDRKQPSRGETPTDLMSDSH